jgi:hypothetical protein
MKDRIADKLADATREKAASGCMRNVPVYGYVNAGFPENMRLVAEAVNDAIQGILPSPWSFIEPTVKAHLEEMGRQLADLIFTTSPIWERLMVDTPIQFSGGDRIQDALDTRTAHPIGSMRIQANPYLPPDTVVMLNTRRLGTPEFNPDTDMAVIRNVKFSTEMVPDVDKDH